MYSSSLQPSTNLMMTVTEQLVLSCLFYFKKSLDHIHGKNRSTSFQRSVFFTNKRNFCSQTTSWENFAAECFLELYSQTTNIKKIMPKLCSFLASIYRDVTITVSSWCCLQIGTFRRFNRVLKCYLYVTYKRYTYCKLKTF